MPIVRSGAEAEAEQVEAAIEAIEAEDEPGVEPTPGEPAPPAVFKAPDA